jgi:hypothetical protein
MNIDTIDKLKAHLKLLRIKLLREGYNELQLYPMFCLYYDKNKERYQLPKEQILDNACEILI